MIYRLSIFKGEKVIMQEDNKSYEWLEGYVTAYLNYVGNNYDYIIAIIG